MWTKRGDDLWAETRKDKEEAVDEEKLLQMTELNPPDKMPNGNVGTPTLVFLDMIRNCLLPQTLIKKLHLQFPKTEGRRIYSNVDYDYHTKNSYDSRDKNGHKSSTSKQNETKILHVKCFESHPKLVPRQTSNLGEYPISNMKVPTASLKLKCTTDTSLNDTNSSFSQSIKERLSSNSNSDHATKAPQRAIETDFKQPNKDMTPPLTAQQRRRKIRAEKLETRKLMAEGIEERLISIDKKYHNDEDAEEWDRHEASEDDPSNQERNKERLYETEEETPWEKGGPGVVFYTDANFWQAREGDFDEQTTDDLDVDFSAYEEAGAGDRDIKDFLKMRQSERFRNGYDKTDRFSIGIAKKINRTSCVKAPAAVVTCANEKGSKTSSHQQSKIGEFEKFSKGVGRRVMERQGWREGQGLGRSQPGIVTAIKAQGQTPKNKYGLGFQEPSYPPSQPLGLAVRKRKPEPHLISTIYDDSRVSDPKVPLLQREEPTTLKHRHNTKAFSRT